MYYNCYMDIVQQGPSYLDKFIRDYYAFIKKLDAVISLDSFAQEWKCIPTGVFSRLRIGSKIYIRDRNGDFLQLEVVTSPEWLEDEELYMITARFTPPNVTGRDEDLELFNEGNVYIKDQTTEHTPTQYRFIHSKALSKGGIKACPTKLITTKTKVPTS